jgi:hypothetical protein
MDMHRSTNVGIEPVSDKELKLEAQESRIENNARDSKQAAMEVS